MTARAVTVEGRTLRLTNLDRVLYPTSNFTKAQVISYYLRVAAVMLPHLHDRPVTLKRYPQGVDQTYFYEKRCPGHRPKWVATGEVGQGEDKLNYCLINNAATLVWVANLASLELHTLLHLYEEPTRPTSMVFDLDPGEGASILDCAGIALDLRNVLKSMGLESFAKTSGLKGLHMHVPLNTSVTFEGTRHISHAIARAYEKLHPDEATSRMAKSHRSGKVFIDWSQNHSHKTTVCVYSMRAAGRPLVSTPVRWDELRAALDTSDADALVFDTDAVIERIKRMGDIFADVLSLKQKLP